MNIILLSGGSGKRLWPLSNETRSKQFLRLLKDGQNQPESMVQRVYRQIKQAGIEASIVVATGRIQMDSIKSQLGDQVDLVLEPERRDTFPAIALASCYLSLVKGMKPDEIMLVLPVDPYAEPSYFSTLVRMEQVVQSGAANLCLMGIRPTYPSAKYGYIVPRAAGPGQAEGSSDNAGDGLEYALVDHFQEKPTEKHAQRLINEGAVWNGGVFAFRLGYLMDLVRRYVRFDTYEDVERQYAEFPRISFDYEVVEKETSIAMVEYSGTWKDLGTWNTLTEVMGDRTNGCVIMSDDCENTHAINELGIPMVVLGARNMVVAASPDGILVSDKTMSAQLKPYVDQVSQRPMYEERRWGEYKVLDYVTYSDGMLSLTKHLFIRAEECISYQRHAIRDEIWTVVDGTGDLLLDGRIRIVRRGDVAHIPKGMLHSVRARTALHIVEVQIGRELTESDIERFDWVW